MDIFNTYTCTPAQAAEVFSATLQRNERLLKNAQADDPQRTGGYFASWRVENEGLVVPVVGFLFGSVAPSERAFTYLYFANEKALRVGTNPTHISSWSSRNIEHDDPLQRKYGGAIRCGKDGHLILSFSGLTEEEDEMLVTKVAWELGLLRKEQIEAIFKVSTNVLLLKFLSKLIELP